MKIVIFAGGKGTRLWPLSRNNFPKQFLSFGEGVSLLQKTILRFLDTYGPHSILVVTNTSCAYLVQDQCLELDPMGRITVLIEPHARSTAPALCLAIRFLEERDRLASGECILAAPSDALFSSEELFLKTVSLAEKGAKKGFISIFGKSPTRAETGYGYLRLGDAKEGGFTVEQFIEKPSQKKAEELVSLNQVFWNLGHILFLPDLFWKEVKKHCPELFVLKELSFEQVLEKMDFLPSITLDQGLLEKSSALLGYTVDCFWSDIGSWDNIYETFGKDENGNVKRGSVVEKDSKHCLFLSEKRLIAAIGLEDLLVVETKDAILVAKRGESQRVKDLVSQDLKQIDLEPESPYQMQKIQIKPYEKRSFPKQMECQERLVILRGIAKIEMEENTCVLEENETVLVPYNTEYSIENRESDLLEILSIQMRGALKVC